MNLMMIPFIPTNYNGISVLEIRQWLKHVIGVTTSMVEYPFDDNNENTEYHFYIILVDDNHNLNTNTGGVYNGITTLKHVLYAYITTLDLVYASDGMTYEYVILEYYGTWKQMLHYMENNYEEPLSTESWLQVYHTNLMGIDVVTTQAYDTMMDEFVMSGYLPGRYATDIHLLTRLKIFECGEVLLGRYLTGLPNEVSQLLCRLINFYVPLAILIAINDDGDYQQGQTFGDWLSMMHITQLPYYNEFYDYAYEIYLNVVGGFM